MEKKGDEKSKKRRLHVYIWTYWNINNKGKIRLDRRGKGRWKGGDEGRWKGDDEERGEEKNEMVKRKEIG